MRDRDLPLFSWTPPACVVIPFPARHRVGKVRHVSEVLYRKRGHDADAYWRRIVNDLRRQMERAGIPSDRIDAEARDFFDAVQADLQRRAWRDHGSPGGAA